MYKKIYDYIVDIDIEEREKVFKNVEKFIKDYQDYDYCGKRYYRDTRKQLENLVEDFKKMEELEVMEEFLWEKVFR